MQAIKLDEFLNYHFLSNVKLSPSADKAAFVVSKSNEEKRWIHIGNLDCRFEHQRVQNVDCRKR